MRAHSRDWSSSVLGPGFRRDDSELDDGTMPLDAGAEHLIHRLGPPVVGKNLDLGIAAKTLRLDGGADALDVDDAVAHHAAVVEDIFGWHQPVADVEGE